MNCPICGKPAKTAPGLRKHLIGARPYGGHQLTTEEAVFTAAGIAPLHPRLDEDADGYLETALALLVNNKKLPKYQFERGVDAFLGVFLPEIVAKLSGDASDVTLVAQEFPLKKPENFMSTNVDYVLHSPGAIRPWIFLELKTDVSSMKDSHAAVYATLAKKSMESLLADVELIAGVAKKKAKYAALLDRFLPYRPVTGDVRVVYLTPKRVDVAALLPKNTPVDSATAFSGILSRWTFADLEGLHLEKYPDAWKLFKEKVVPEVVARLSGREPRP